MRRTLRWLGLIACGVVMLLVGCAWLLVWQMRVTAAWRPWSVAEEAWFLFGNVVALAFVVWCLSKAIRRLFGCPSVTHWLFSWRILRRGLIGLTGFITLIAAFYTVENWRGGRAWERCKHELEAKGEKLDWEAFIPPPVPDDQNFFKAPGMAAWFSRKAWETNQNVQIYSVGSATVKSAMLLLGPARWTLDGLRSIPEMPLDGLRSIPEMLAETNKAASAMSRTALRLAFAQYEPEFRLLADACARPQSRLADDYATPFTVSISSVVNARNLAQQLSVHAGLKLLDGQPEVAVEDLGMIRRLGVVMDDNYTLAGTMINVAIQGLYLQTARDALAAGLWKEPQLAALQQQTRDVNLLASLAGSLRGFARAGAIRLLDGPPAELAKAFATAQKIAFGPNDLGGIDWLQLFTQIKIALCPRGWIQQNQAYLARADQELLDALDTSRRRIHAARVGTMNEHSHKLSSSTSPYTFLAARSMPNFVRALETLARTQTQLDQLHVACALERYRLAQGGYPEKLEALMPALLDHVPKDLFADGPLKYRRDDKGGYLLWSVGWDEKDDGGAQSFDKDGKPAFDANPGDWVWQLPVQVK